jgi:hypothetical protein
VSDNCGGSNANIGTDTGAEAASDGYAMLFTVSGPIVTIHAM